MIEITLAIACIGCFAAVIGAIKNFTDLRGGSRKAIRDEYEFINRLLKDWETKDAIHPGARNSALYAFAGRTDVEPNQIALFIRHPAELRTYLNLRSRLAPVAEPRRIAFKPKWEKESTRKRHKLMSRTFVACTFFLPLLPFLAPFSSIEDRALKVALALLYMLILDWWLLYEYVLTKRAEELVERQPLLMDSVALINEPKHRGIAADAAAAIELAKGSPTSTKQNQP